MPSKMITSSQPYLLRAFHQWMTDNDLTPYIVVNAAIKDTQVPAGYANAQQLITLNISYAATQNLLMNNDAVTFSARFQGVAHHIYLPMESILSIFSAETTQGIQFNPTDFNQTDENPALTPPSLETLEETPEIETHRDAPDLPTPPKKKPTLTIVK